MKYTATHPVTKGSLQNGCDTVVGLSGEDIEHFRTILLQRREEAADEIGRLRLRLADAHEQAGDSSAYSSDAADGASGAREREGLYIMIGRQQKYLRHLDQALARIAKGTYGICRVTGRTISKERLEVVPHTTTSVEAKQKRR